MAPTKLLGVVTMAMLALGAVTTASASATVFVVEKYPAVVVGGQLGNHGFIFEGIEVSCEKIPSFGVMTQSAETLSLAPIYETCEASEKIASVEPGECVYRLKAGEEFAAGRFTGTLDFVCPEGKVITIVFGPFGNCEVQIGSQNGLAGLLLDNQAGAPKKIAVTTVLETIKYTVTKDGFACPLNGAGVKTNGGYAGVSLLAAQSGSAVGIYVE